MNEKSTYNEATGPMLQFDGVRCEYPNMLMFAIFDQANYDAFRGGPFDGGAMPAVGADDRHVITGETLEQLAEGIDERLALLAHATGGVRLAPDFAAQLAASVARFNGFAHNGHDDDFRRGDAAVERYLYNLILNATKMGTNSPNQALFGMAPDDEEQLESIDAGIPRWLRSPIKVRTTR